jgi:hypothetical protein
VRTRSIVCVLVLVVVVAGCRGGGSKVAASSSTTATVASTSTSTSTSTTATVEGTSTTTTTAEPSDVPSGRSFGFITAFGAGDKTISFDLATYLTGAAADKAAAEDGVVAKGEHVPNDHYIRNVNKRLRTLTLGKPLQVKVVDCTSGPCKTVTGTLATLKTRTTPIPVWITVLKTLVVQIEEQYEP